MVAHECCSRLNRGLASVAQTSKSAVSQISKSAERGLQLRFAGLGGRDTAGLETCATVLAGYGRRYASTRATPVELSLPRTIAV